MCCGVQSRGSKCSNKAYEVFHNSKQPSFVALALEIWRRSCRRRSIRNGSRDLEASFCV